MRKLGIAQNQLNDLRIILQYMSYMGHESSFPDSVTSMVPNFDTQLCEDYLDLFYGDPLRKNETIRLTNKDWASINLADYKVMYGKL